MESEFLEKKIINEYNLHKTCDCYKKLDQQISILKEKINSLIDYCRINYASIIFF